MRRKSPQGRRRQAGQQRAQQDNQASGHRQDAAQRRRKNMKGRSEKVIADRRGFLKLAGAGVATGSAIVTGTAGEVKAAPADKKVDGDYRETEHVRRYYELAR
jgi:hypothetical protein